MATSITVPTEITPAEFTTMDTNTTSTGSILTLVKIVLTPSQVKSKLSVAVIKSSLITDVNTSLVKTNTPAVPSTLDIPTYQADILYLARLKALQATLAQHHNEVTTLVEVAQHNLMNKTNIILTNARIVAKTDKGVADAMAVLDTKYFTHTTPSSGVIITIAIAGVMTLSGINPTKPFTNREKTMLSILNVGGSSANTIKLNGFTSVILPKEWVNIVVTNLSITDEGGVEVFMK